MKKPFEHKANAAHLFRAAGEAGPKIIGVFKQTSLTKLGRFRSAPPRLSIEDTIMFNRFKDSTISHANEVATPNICTWLDSTKSLPF